jgi:hypothetical protein
MGPLLRNQDLIKSLISPYISDMPATQPREINPATCSASMISLVIGVTAIAEGAMSLRLLTLLALKLDTAISGDSNLCIMQCCCFFDLSLDEIKGVHCRSPKEMRFLLPVPSVVCVPIELTFWHIVLNGLDQLYLIVCI